MTPELSVVIPVFNEAPNLEPLARELSATLDAWGRPFEVIFVDDGSQDETFDVLARLHAADPRFVVIQLRRNFGQTAAFAAGFAAARGRLIATSDGDLQNDPRDLPALVARIDEGYDVVCGWRKDRKDPLISRRLPSMLANRLISWATGVRLNDYGCSLKVFRAEVIKSLRLYGELHRFLPALASEQGVRIAEQPVNHRARVHGTSKYGIGRTMRVVLDLMTVKFLLSYSTRPLQIFGLVGVPMGLAGAAILGYLGALRLLGLASLNERMPLVTFGMLLVFIGLQFVTLGLIAELQARTYHESQDKRIYVVRQVLGATMEGGVSGGAGAEKVTSRASDSSLRG
ncbi:MAG TPA: glycosyltransferase family 2 protein [Vicinamibacterales bacterium]|nr:glycosyltransferase family 2 protein [Vicinamibacterales bacterium]